MSAVYHVRSKSHPVTSGSIEGTDFKANTDSFSLALQSSASAIPRAAQHVPTSRIAYTERKGRGEQLVMRKTDDKVVMKSLERRRRLFTLQIQRALNLRRSL